MSIRFRCKNCNQKYEMEEDCSGETVECAKCKTPMVVPPESEIPPSASSTQVAAPAVEAPVTDDKKSEIQEVMIPASTSGEIVLRCKVCNQKYRLPKELAGQTAECAKCKNPIIIPGAPDIAPLDAASKENVTLWCKSCGQKLCMPKALAGQDGQCTKCKKVFKVPAESEAKLAGMLSRLRQEVSEKRDAPAKILPKNPAAAESNPAAETPALSKAVKSKSKNQTAEKDQTSATGEETAIASIKYVLEMPKRNFFFASFSLVIDRLMQTKLLHRMPRKLVIFLLFFTAFLAVLTTYCGIKLCEISAKNELKINVMCANCSLCETRPIKNIFTDKCSKCKGPLGFQWKCNACNKIFTRIEIISEDNPIQYDKINTITPPVCPFCSSTAVKYNSETAVGQKP